MTEERKKNVIERLRKHFIPYEHARVYIRTVRPKITSKVKYKKWMKKARPKFMPSEPEAVWREEGFTWPDFLGTTNSFGVTRYCNPERRAKEWRMMWEAIRYVQQLANDNKLKTMKDWRLYYDEHKDEMPDDIPRSPEHVYKGEFPGYHVWLGKDIQSKVQAIKGVISLITLHHVEGESSNVVEYRIWKEGMSQYREGMRSGMIGELIRGYEIDNDRVVSYMEGMLNKYGTKHGSWYIIRDMNGLLWDLMDLKIASIGR